MQSVLEIDHMSIDFDTGRAPVHVLRDISLTVPAGEIVGIVGESGSGKSTLALAIMRLLSGNARVTAGRIIFDDKDILKLTEDAMREIRGRRIAMVFQVPMTSLNPVRSIGRQMLDIQRHGADGNTASKRSKAAAVLKRVGIPDADQQLDNYAFQFSGGMRQRIAIAMGMIEKPEILIADEVTTALDVTLEAQILHLLRELRDEIGCAILFISHNLGAVAELCDRVLVLYAGEVVEQGPITDIFYRPQHPYSRALIACDPARISEVTRDLPVIAGEVPNLAAIPRGCIFSPRCTLASDLCHREAPAMFEVGNGHFARCHFAEAVAPR